jgi:Glycosyltransferase 61/Glycosyl transferase family 2
VDSQAFAHRAVHDAQVQAFRFVVGLPGRRYIGGPVLHDPADDPLRYCEYGAPADSFVSGIEYRELLTGVFNYVGPVYHHFGHIMAEMVHRILPSRRCFRDERWLAVNGIGQSVDYQELPSTYRAALEFLGIGSDNLTVVNSDVVVECLNIAQQGWTYGLPPSPAYLRMLTDYSEPRLTELCGDSEPIEKLYVSRSRQMQGGNLLGESYIEKCLEDEGFIVLYPEDHSISSQMNFYRRAKRAVFLEGSACHGTQLLGEHSLGHVLLVLRRQEERLLFRSILEHRAKSFDWFDRTQYLGTCVLHPENDQPLSHLGQSIADPAELTSFLQRHDAATLANLDRQSFCEAARRDFRRYIDFHRESGSRMASADVIDGLVARVRSLCSSFEIAGFDSPRLDSAVAVSDLSGRNYLSVLSEMHDKLEPERYLEIGSYTGDSAALSQSHSIIIDPDLSKLRNVMGKKLSLMAFQMSSDQFFASYEPTKLWGAPVEFAFLDGMHLLEHILRDFVNVEKSCSNEAVIVLHDCIPTDVEIASRINDQSRRKLHPDWWTGDVWKIIPVLRKIRPNLRVFAVNAAPTGLLIVTNLDPRSTILYDRQKEIFQEWADVDLGAYGLSRFLDECQLISTDEFVNNILPDLARRPDSGPNTTCSETKVSAAPPPPEETTLFHPYLSISAGLQAEIPVVIPCFNAVTYARGMVEQLRARGLRRLILVDNASTYAPMREYLAAPGPGVTVIAQAENKGPHDAFLDPASLALMPQFFCLTDADLLLNPAMPEDFLAQLAALTESLSIGKAGLAIDIADRATMRQEDFLIVGQYRKIWDWEEQFWLEPLEPLPGGDPVFRAEIDTTFALYNKRFFDKSNFLKAVRVAGRYTCRHLPWYNDIGLPPEEEQFYRSHAQHSYYLGDDPDREPDP